MIPVKKRPVVIVGAAITATILLTLTDLLEVFILLGLLCNSESIAPYYDHPCAPYVYGYYLVLAWPPIASVTGGGWLAVKRNRFLPLILGFVGSLMVLLILPLYATFA